jgi:hypothetical protein
MKDAIIFTLVVVLLFLIFNGSKFDTYTDDAAVSGEAVPPDVIQAIIEKVQEADPDIVPLETLFVNSRGNGDYTARLMFFNTRSFTGHQYDVEAQVGQDGTVGILSTTAAARPMDRSYEPDKYKSWESVQEGLDSQLKSLLSKQTSQVPKNGPAPYDATMAAENLKTQ